MNKAVWLSVFLIACVLLGGVQALSINQTIVSTTDDAHEIDGSTVTTSAGDCVAGNNSFNIYKCGLRWQINVSKNADITHASIRTKADSWEPSPGLHALRIYLEASDNCSAYSTTSGSISSRTLTTNYVEWFTTGTLTWDGTYTSTDFSAVIEEVTSRSGWTNGSYICPIIVGNQTATTNSYGFGATGGSHAAPKLELTWTDAVETTTQATISVDTDNTLRIVPEYYFGINPDVFLASSTFDSNGSANVTETRAVLNELYNGITKILRVNVDLRYVGTDGVFSNDQYRIVRETVQYAYNESVAGRPTKVRFVITNVPSHLANVSAGICTAGNNWSCPSNDMAAWGDLAKNATYNLSWGGVYLPYIDAVEILNEVYNQNHFANSLAYDSVTRYTYSNQMYNVGYTSIKAYNSSIRVVMPSANDYSGAPNFLDNWFANHANDSDELNIHFYNWGSGEDYADADAYINYETDTVYDLCNYWNATYCETMRPTETGVYDNTLVTADDNKTEAQFLRLHGSLIKLPYVVGDDPYYLQPYSFNENPRLNLYCRKGMCSSSTGTYYRTFNATQNVAAFCSPGAKVHNSTSNESNTFSLACREGTNLYVAVTPNATRNVTVSLSGLNASAAINNKTGASYTVTSNSVNLGVVQADETVYLQMTVNADVTAPSIGYPIKTYVTPTTLQVNFTCDEACNASINYGTTLAMGNYSNITYFITNHSINITGLAQSTFYYYNITVTDAEGNDFTSGANTAITTAAPPSVFNVTILPGTGSISEDLGGYCTVESANSSNITYYGQWWNGSNLYSEVSGGSSVSSPTSAGATYDGWNAIALGLYGRAKWVGLVQSYESFGFDVPSLSSISNISVTIQTDCGTSGTPVDLAVALSIDGGSTWGTTHTLTAPALVGACTGHTETITGVDWGLGSVQGSDMSDANFAVRVNKSSGGDGLNTEFSDLDVSFDYDIVEVSGTQVLIDTIDNSLLSDGETWRFACYGNDGTADSDITNSTGVTIADDAFPEIEMIYSYYNGLSFIELTPTVLTLSQTANLYANITEDSVSIVNITIVKGGETWIANLSQVTLGSGIYEITPYLYSFSDTDELGQYNYTVVVEDSAGNVNSTTGSFTVTDNPTGSGGGGGTPPPTETPGGSAGAGGARVETINATFTPKFPIINTFAWLSGDYKQESQEYVISTNKNIDSCVVAFYEKNTTPGTFSCYYIDKTLYVTVDLTSGNEPIAKVFAATMRATSSDGEQMEIPIKVTTVSVKIESSQGLILWGKVIALGLIIGLSIWIFTKALEPSSSYVKR